MSVNISDELNGIGGGGGGGGEIPAPQFDLLVTDPELGTAVEGLQSAITSVVNSTATTTQNAIAQHDYSMAGNVDIIVNELGNIHNAVDNVQTNITSTVNSTATATQTAVANSQTAVINDVNSTATATQTAVANSQAAVVAAINALIQSGDTRLFTTSDGNAPTGWSKASGQLVPTGLFGQTRVVLTNGLVSPTCMNANKTFAFTSTAGTSYSWDLGTSAQASVASYPLSSNTIGLNIADNTYAYSFGTYVTSGGTPATTCHRYVISTNTWSAIQPLLSARKFATGIVLANGNSLIVGGCNAASVSASTLMNEVLVYNSGSNTYTTKAAAPFRSYSGYTCLLSNGDVLFLFNAGQTSNDGATTVSNARAFVYHVSNDTWTELDVPSSVGHPLQIADGRIVCVGTTLANSLILNTSAASGSQWSSYPLTQPTGLSVVSFGSYQASVGIGGIYLPISFSSQYSALVWVGSAVASSASSFYAVKN